MGESGAAFPRAEELVSFKYSELQSLAKSVGLRANLRGDKLLKSLKEYFQHEVKKENESRNDKSDISASPYGEIEMFDGNEEKSEQETVVASVTTPLKGDEVAPGNSVSKNHSEMIQSDCPGSHRQKKYENNLLAIEEAKELSKDNQNKQIIYTEGNIMEGAKSPHCKDGLSRPKKRRTILTTPNFKKIHEAHFKEMESIDKYIDRKKKRMEVLNNSVKELKTLAKKANLTVTPHSKSKKSSSQIKVLSPPPQRGRPSSTCTPGSSYRRSLRTSIGSTNRSILCQKLFKPSVLSTNKMNVRFSEATKDNEYKRSLTKTPARKSPYNSLLDTQPKCQAVVMKNKDTEAGQAKDAHTAAAVTPFKFTAEAVQTPVSNKKPVFDLKASLSRPLRYEPHKGKLKPWGESKENNVNETANRIDFHKKTYKQPHLQTREEQRKKHEQKRKEKKDRVVGTRRGLVMLGD